MQPYEEMLNDAVPATGQLLERVNLWGAANQYVDGSFCVRRLLATEPCTLSLQELVGPGNTVIRAAEIDLRVVQLRRRSLNLWEKAIRQVTLPDLLLRDDRTAVPPTGKQGGFGGGACVTAIPQHESRQFWITIHIPTGSPPGRYDGALVLGVAGDPSRTMSLPVELEVLSLELMPVEGHYSIFYRSQSVDPTEKKAEASYVPLERYRAELQDQVRHGANAAILYGGPATLKYAKDAGMTEAPVVLQSPAADPLGLATWPTPRPWAFPISTSSAWTNPRASGLRSAARKQSGGCRMASTCIRRSTPWQLKRP